uniref:ATP synthase F0 subunit 8 n=1 Tax=Acanthochitona defilippii TaxID=761903 RepID=UPI0030FED793
MPQLAPLNWIFLFILFWGSVLFIFIFIWWWNSKIYNFFFIHKKSSMMAKKWLW